MNFIFSVLFVFAVTANDVTVQPTATEQAVLTQINDYRAQRKLQPLKLCTEMLIDCRDWAQTLKTKRQWRHWNGGRENLYMSTSANVSAKRIFEKWRTSPGHHALLVSAGPYVAVGGYEGHYVMRTATSVKEYQERKQRTQQKGNSR